MTTFRSSSTPCIVQHRYRVDPVDVPQLLDLLAQVRDYALDLGIADFHLWQDQDDPWQWTELQHFDSWSHMQRLAQKEMPAGMQEIYEELARLQARGETPIQTHVWSPVELAETPE